MHGKRLVILALLLLMAPIGAEVYKWVDEKGNTHYSDKAPPDEQAQELTISPPPPTEQAPQPADKPGEATQVESESDREGEVLMADEVKPVGEVFGSIVLSFRILERASLPPTSMRASLSLKPDGRGDLIKRKISPGDIHWERFENKSPQNTRGIATINFSESLPAGRYLIRSVQIRSPEMASSPFSLPVGLDFRVPREQKCVYIGRGIFSYVRIPPSDRTRQQIYVGDARRQFGEALDHIYLRSGGLVLLGRAIDMPLEDEQKPLILASKQHYLRAKAKGCKEQAAQF